MTTHSENTLATRLRHLMEQHGLSEAELARETQLPQPTVHRLISGDTLDPRVSTLEIFTQYFNVTFDYLLGRNPLLPHSQLGLLHNAGTHPFPIIDWEDIRGFFNKIPEITGKYTQIGEWTTTELALSTQSFALRSRPSMEPRFSRGTLIFIDPTQNAQDNDLVLVEYKDEKQFALRYLCIDGKIKTLHSLATPSISEPLNDTIEVLGVVMQSKLTFHPTKK